MVDHRYDSIQMMSERQATEMVQHGEVLTWTPVGTEQAHLVTAMEANSSGRLQPMPGGRWDDALAMERAALRIAHGLPPGIRAASVSLA